MARRKPSGIIDVVKDVVSPWLGTPPGQYSSVTKAQGLARGAAEGLDQMFAGGMIKAGVQGNKALAKQTAINAAALGTGYIAGKAAVTAAGAVVKSGVPARVVNKVTSQMIGVHGSPVSGLKTINPTLSPSAIREGYTNPQVYAANPVVGKSLSTATDYSQVTGDQRLNRLTQYLRGEKTLPSKNDSIGGSVYIVKGKTRSIKKEIKKDFANSSTPVPKLKNFPIIVSSKPFKVVKEFPVKDDLSTFYNDLKRYGGKLPKKK